MFGKKKGQAAMEYLMTYGWAILAVVIVGGVLYYYGVFEPDVPDQACPTASIGVDHGDWVIEGNQLDLVATNNEGSEITLNTITSEEDLAEDYEVENGTLGVADSMTIEEIGLENEYGPGDTVEIELTFEYEMGELTPTSTCTITGEA